MVQALWLGMETLAEEPEALAMRAEAAAPDAPRESAPDAPQRRRR